MEGEAYKQWKSGNDAAQDAARKEGERLLGDEPWLCDLLDAYLDAKDWGRTGPEYNTQYVKDAFRCIRQGSCGLLGNPPLM